MWLLVLWRFYITWQKNLAAVIKDAIDMDLFVGPSNHRGKRWGHVMNWGRDDAMLWIHCTASPPEVFVHMCPSLQGGKKSQCCASGEKVFWWIQLQRLRVFPMETLLHACWALCIMTVLFQFIMNCINLRAALRLLTTVYNRISIGKCILSLQEVNCKGTLECKFYVCGQPLVWLLPQMFVFESIKIF